MLDFSLIQVIKCIKSIVPEHEDVLMQGDSKEVHLFTDKDVSWRYTRRSDKKLG